MERKYYVKGKDYPHGTKVWFGNLPKLGTDEFGNRWARDNRGYVYLVDKYPAIIINPLSRYTMVVPSLRYKNEGVKYYYDNFTSVGYDRTLKQKIADLDKDILDEDREAWEYLKKRYNFL